MQGVQRHVAAGPMKVSNPSRHSHPRRSSLQPPGRVRFPSGRVRFPSENAFVARARSVNYIERASGAGELEITNLSSSVWVHVRAVQRI